MATRFLKFIGVLFIFLLVLGLFLRCTEPFSVELPPSEGLLVVDATITNELKNHSIFLSRSSQNQDIPQWESNASVRIVDDAQQEYNYTEIAEGNYRSDLAFSALPSRAYTLFITTANGESFTSSEVKTPVGSNIEKVFAEKTITDDGLEAVAIRVNSFDPTGNSVYYKYEYEETYKIIAPKWSPNEFVVLSENPFFVDVKPRREENRVCYATDLSSAISLVKTSGSGEDRISGFAVRFLDVNNFKISHRYSILVKQNILSPEAYSFYENIKNFSGSGSLLSQNQPGFVSGNIFPDGQDGESVVGIFEVSYVSEQRFFFNYSDFFPGQNLPPFINECDPSKPSEQGLEALITADLIGFSDFNLDPLENEGRFIVQGKACGDCTALGSTTIPEFWIEE